MSLCERWLFIFLGSIATYLEGGAIKYLNVDRSQATDTHYWKVVNVTNYLAIVGKKWTCWISLQNGIIRTAGYTEHFFLALLVRRTIWSLSSLCLRRCRRLKPLVQIETNWFLWRRDQYVLMKLIIPLKEILLGPKRRNIYIIMPYKLRTEARVGVNPEYIVSILSNTNHQIEMLELWTANFKMKCLSL